jgi:integral membrane protein
MSPTPTEGALVDIKTASSLHRLRLVSAPEAVSFLLLLVCSVLKRTTEFNAVPVMGAIHGVLFILYVLFWLDAWNRTKWNAKTAAVYFVLSVLPFGGFVAERKLKRAADDEVIAARARREGKVNA